MRMLYRHPATAPRGARSASRAGFLIPVRSVVPVGFKIPNTVAMRRAQSEETDLCDQARIEARYLHFNVNPCPFRRASCQNLWDFRAMISTGSKGPHRKSAFRR